MTDTPNQSTELIAHVVGRTEGWVLEPAGVRRDWMDATDGFAYRCLPLVIANQAGWVVRLPCDVTATWNGGQAGSDIHLALPPDHQSYSDQILSHFGWGILTFSVPWLFRTPPGIGMLVRGPTNSPKPGIAALEGFVETDWAAATFTMNWKITDPDRPITFRKGEPICQLTPFPIDLLEQLTPRLTLLSDDKDLADRYRAWSQSRSIFNAKPDRKPEEWQRDYFRGQTVDGAKAPEHRTKVRLAQFKPRPD